MRQSNRPRDSIELKVIMTMVHGEEVDHRDNNRSNNLKLMKMKDLTVTVLMVMDLVTFFATILFSKSDRHW